MTPESWLTFERLARLPEAPPARRRLESGTLWCALAGVVGTAPACAVYISRHWHAMAPQGWTQLVVQVVTFVVVGGAFCGVSISAGLCLSRYRRLRLLGAVLGGAAAAAVLGLVGASHFGLMSLPYFGGSAILSSIGLAVLLAAAGFARTESELNNAPLAPLSCLLCAVLPAPAFAVIVLMALLIEPGVAALDLDAMRELTSYVGLPTLGALGGGFLGMLGATWFASSALLGERMSRER